MVSSDSAADRPHTVRRDHDHLQRIIGLAILTSTWRGGVARFNPAGGAPCQHRRPAGLSSCCRPRPARPVPRSPRPSSPRRHASLSSTSYVFAGSAAPHHFRPRHRHHDGRRCLHATATWASTYSPRAGCSGRPARSSRRRSRRQWRMPPAHRGRRGDALIVLLPDVGRPARLRDAAGADELQPATVRDASTA